MAGARPAPTRTRCSSQASDTVRAKGPTWSRVRDKRHHAVDRHLAICRLQADSAACSRWNPDRPARVGPERRDCHPGRDGHRGATARAARGPRGIVWIAHGAERGVLARGPVRKLVQVGLADDDRAGAPKLYDDGCIGISTMTIAHAGRGGRRDAFDVDQILDGDRNAMELDRGRGRRRAHDRPPPPDAGLRQPSRG